MKLYGPSGLARCKRCNDSLLDSAAESSKEKRKAVQNDEWLWRSCGGQVDGLKHRKAGSKTTDVAPRGTSGAAATAKETIDDFTAKFSLTGERAKHDSIIDAERERLTAKQQEMDEAREKIEVRSGSSGSSARFSSRTARFRPPPLLTHMILTLPSPPSPPTSYS